MKENIRKLLLAGGATAVGFAEAGIIDSKVGSAFEKWIMEGNHADMQYLERHIPLRKDPENVLKGTRTIISLAFSYVPERWREESLSYIATYAYGEDYHEVIRKRLNPIIKQLREEYGGDWRLCIDSAPVEERYWAVKSGIGVRGENGAVIVKKCGSFCFLAEILTTLSISRDKESVEKCDGCGKCVSKCPTGALKGDGKIDARKCISYLTIEKKGEFSEEEKEMLKRSTYKEGFLFGCDLCLRVCPHNQGLELTDIDEFKGKERILNLATEDIEKTEEREFNEKFRNSVIKRCKFEGISRNITYCKK